MSRKRILEGLARSVEIIGINSRYGKPKQDIQYWELYIADDFIGFVRGQDAWEAKAKAIRILSAMPWIEPQAITVKPSEFKLMVKGGDA